MNCSRFTLDGRPSIPELPWAMAVAGLLTAPPGHLKTEAGHVLP
ncbi:MAG: hypothetical protein AB1791_23170 [Chloroflexota bacterium]